MVQESETVFGRALPSGPLTFQGEELHHVRCKASDGSLLNADHNGVLFRCPPDQNLQQTATQQFGFGLG